MSLVGAIPGSEADLTCGHIGLLIRDVECGCRSPGRIGCPLFEAWFTVFGARFFTVANRSGCGLRSYWCCQYRRHGSPVVVQVEPMRSWWCIRRWEVTVSNYAMSMAGHWWPLGSLVWWINGDGNGARLVTIPLCRPKVRKECQWCVLLCRWWAFAHVVSVGPLN